MKKPIFNEEERWEIREVDCLLSSMRKLTLAKLHFLRSLDRGFKKLFKINNDKKTKKIQTTKKEVQKTISE